MKRYILVKEKIMGERDYSWKEAQDILMDMNARGIQNEFFQGYFWSWREHPEIAPSSFTLLSMILPVYKNERIDLELLMRLDQEAKGRQEKLIFTIDDATEVFSTFYKEFIEKPLSLELKRGATGTALTKYFE